MKFIGDLANFIRSSPIIPFSLQNKYMSCILLKENVMIILLLSFFTPLKFPGGLTGI